ncbi:MAG: 3-deoxy-7-phosphoheptulonate synthase [Chitinispirillaceae bacterium]|nr:3-deoxy-7-phosphoheptulonate synthase [Chitinispirillaceae bacterium]
MIIVLKPNAKKDEIDHVVKLVEEAGLRAHISEGERQTIVGVIGDKTRLSDYSFASFPYVESIIHVSKPYKLASIDFHPQPTVIKVKGSIIGGGNLGIIGGPCCIENEKQLMTIAESVKKSGANFLRGGAFKPRTSPYAFQGMGEEGLKLLKKAGELFEIPVVTEVMDTSAVKMVSQYADVLQIGTRNAQYFSLLKEVGKIDKPVILKRGMAQTIEEWLMSAEYIMSEGNGNVILCERGIRTFETATRNTLDILSIPAVKERSHLPIIVDPSHAAGKWQYVTSMALAAIVAGSDGIMVEVHNDPEKALSDGAQSLKPAKFEELVKEILKLKSII